MGRKTRRLHALVAVGKHEEVVSPRSFLVLSALHDDKDDEEEDEELAPTREDSDDVSAAAAADDDDDLDTAAVDSSEPTGAAVAPVLLHIGAQAAAKHPEWRIVDIQPGDYVDDVLPMDDLSPSYDDDSVNAIYASHVLEHCHYGVFVQHAATGGSCSLGSFAVVR
ncbi:hypothetical protein ATCC90586_012191 [Pythium insidiosum]|nr:hypothetical protein ATCC90586_012191 [Pythium insidiosum]